MKHWYQELFENYAKKYDQESFTQGTLQEVDFIEKELGFDKTLRILDVGCGTGRHSIELVKRGYSVVGADLSEAQLSRAKEKAATEKLSIPFLLRDARELGFESKFDVALILCEGAFPLLETDQENYRVLQSVSQALKPRGKLILTTLNALYPLHHSVDDFINESNEANKSFKSRFDLLTFRMTSEFQFTDDDGKVHTVHPNERYYAPSEMSWLLGSLGFEKVSIFGCATGAFSREKPLTYEDFEMLVIAGRQK